MVPRRRVGTNGTPFMKDGCCANHVSATLAVASHGVWVRDADRRRARENEKVSFLPADLYATIEASIPIACVDFVPIRRSDHGLEVGLILRESPFGQVWCHLGGRVLHGETLRQAIDRHAVDTLGIPAIVDHDPQPDFVYQWFPPAVAPHDGTAHGKDPRKHAIGLSFLVEIDGEPVPRNEALDFRYVVAGALPDRIWPGSAELIAELTRRSR
ncbi:DUF4916 domain-containing protein [Microbacterium sp. QXD-8]|uniref:DUF4916 domain-containing protein n=1 Tax=Microbacterium psychrotolerans TaxID=3068321 RepID=A0ABU0Z1B7_9MICO|nr:DUF4916 domain-containing protein [Microbacterium sp. QXD-8]MDQ7878357.1 DUF4916 domain-containing protein [Microbacterium sp. QXD-8]